MRVTRRHMRVIPPPSSPCPNVALLNASALQAHGEVWPRSAEEVEQHSAEFQERLSHWTRTCSLFDEAAKPLANVLSALAAPPSAPDDDARPSSRLLAGGAVRPAPL